MFYDCLMNIQGPAPDAASLPSHAGASRSSLTFFFSRHQKSDSGKKKKILHDPPTSHPQLYLTPAVYATHEMSQSLNELWWGQREAHTHLSKYCFNYVVVENRAWSRGLGLQAASPPLSLSSVGLSFSSFSSSLHLTPLSLCVSSRSLTPDQFNASEGYGTQKVK